uniref:metaxin-3-like n=1 Tax=Myxine glutinosa TaxID=7769 RepID=UPI0035902671
MAARMELYCWRDDWGLPSADMDCLLVLSYASIARAPLKLRQCCHPWNMPTRALPTFRCGDDVLSKPVEIIRFLRRMGYKPDSHLLAKQEADVVAFSALIEQMLLPALLHTFWVDPQNYVELIRPWYGATMGFPYSLILPYLNRRKVISRLEFSVGRLPFITIKETEAQIYRNARECMNLLSHQLGKQDYFFGNLPSTLDAVVFAHLAPLLRAPLLGRTLQLHLKALPNLCQHCSRMLNYCFPAQSAEGGSRPEREQMDANLQKLTELVNKESNLIEKMDGNLRANPKSSGQGKSSQQVPPDISSTNGPTYTAGH